MNIRWSSILKKSFFLILPVVWLSPITAFADVKLPSLISDNMVLQRGVNTRIWGWADVGEKVTVTLQQQSVSTSADEKGNWQVHLPPFKAGGPFEITVKGNNVIRVSNILIGEVWVVAGQSNIWWPVHRTTNAKKEVADAKYPRMRLLTVPIRAAQKPLTDIEDINQPNRMTVPKEQSQWVECNPDTVPWFSGVAYYFGRELHKELNVPVGLISMGVGGTVVNAWTSKEALENEPACQHIINYWDYYSAVQYPQKKAEYEKKLDEWKSAAKLASDANNPEPAKPAAPINPETYVNHYSALYNAMVAPVTPYTIKGAVWYQGESDASQAFRYEKSLFAMINDWRNAWGIGSFPFLIVQLPNLDTSQFTSLGKDWATMRQAQASALELPNTGLVVTIDIGDANDAHPKNKQDVGYRLSLTARAIAYGHDIDYSGPMYKSMAVKGNKVRIKFDYVDGGLVAKGGKLTGFTIAGPALKLLPAEAKIDGNDVVVWNDQIEKPVAVRYAWLDNPVCNLYNKAGLPAGPFRTDNMPDHP